MLGSIKAQMKGEERTLVCTHWRMFPPKGYRGDREELRASKAITVAEYQQIAVWERICGRFKMDGEECAACPHVLYMQQTPTGPKTVDVQGVARYVVDIPTHESAPRNRNHLGINIAKNQSPDARKKTP